MLGVSFSTNLNDMLNLNYQKALSTIRQLIDTWSKRSLSVLGRITLVKSLLLSNFITLLKCCRIRLTACDYDIGGSCDSTSFVVNRLYTDFGVQRPLVPQKF